MDRFFRHNCIIIEIILVDYGHEGVWNKLVIKDDCGKILYYYSYQFSNMDYVDIQYMAILKSCEILEEKLNVK